MILLPNPTTTAITSNSLFQGPKEPNWGPNGKSVYERTYQRTKANGEKETWDETVQRVVRGNLSLVPKNRTWPGEEEELYSLIHGFHALPGGRHLWMSGVEGRQFLFNCYVSGWGDRLSDHFAFTFNQLMEGGGVGANYSAKYLMRYPIYVMNRVHIVCSPEHDDYDDLMAAGILSTEYDSEWNGAYEVPDSREGWKGSLVTLIDIVSEWNRDRDFFVFVVDVSNIRSAGKRIKTFGGTASGPLPFAKMLKDVGHLLNEAWETGMTGPLAMEIDHAISECVVSGNVRRSARMSQMHWKDPYIDWFLECKSTGAHWSTNISVEIDDDFVAYIGNPLDESLDAQRAAEVYEKIIEGMLRNGEPGIWNSSLANVGEPNPVIATNPCGEICLEPWENCNLGHVNLSAFVDTNGTVDYEGLQRAHELMTRFLIRATFGDITDEKTREVSLRNRRIGVGHFGFADFLALIGVKYSESWDSPNVVFLLQEMSAVVRKAATEYAHELRIPVPVKTRTIAPTGTISKLPGVNGEGIHPVFAKYYIQRIRFSPVDPDQAAQLEDYKIRGFNVLEDPVRSNTMVVEIPMKATLLQRLEDLGRDTDVLEDASEISFGDMLRVQRMYQTYWADNAVSFTVNVNPTATSHTEISRIMRRFLDTLKGSTVFPERGYELAPYERVPREIFEALRGSEAVFGDAVDESCANGACPVR